MTDAEKLDLLAKYRDMLRDSGGDWAADLVANDLTSILEDTTPDELCGDYPAPCNCDDPTTHNGH